MTATFARERIVAAFVVLASMGISWRMLFKRAQWRKKTLRLVEMLEENEGTSDEKTVSFAGFGGLPAPVARYLRFALREGQPFIHSVRITQSGELRISPTHKQWRKFRAVQFFSPNAPGFVWDAHVSMPLGIKIRVRDAYSGHGLGQVDVASLVTVAQVEDKTELSEAALMRYLAEAVWFPTALLPSSAGIVWSAIDEKRALATLTAGATTVSLEFGFGGSGEVTSIYTPGRYREVQGGFELTPWEGYHRDYQEINGMQIPTTGEVAWHLPEGKFTVWRGRNEYTQFDLGHKRKSPIKNHVTHQKNSLPR